MTVKNYIGEGKRYTVNEIPLNKDTFNSCVVFQGQGNSYQSMFTEEISSFGKKYIKIADNFLEKKINLTLTEYIEGSLNPENYYYKLVSNMGLFVYQLIVFYHYESKNKDIDIITSHSFGEFAAWVCAGFIEYDVMLEIVFERELICLENHSKGILVAVQKDYEELIRILPKDLFYLSNKNSKTQIVIGVENDNFKKVKSILIKNNIKYNVLTSVPHPFHTKLMKEISDELGEKLSPLNIFINEPKYQFYSSVIGLVSNKVEIDIKKIVLDQLTQQMDFQSNVLNLYKNDTRHFVEIGPRKVCLNFIDDILVDKYHISTYLDFFVKNNLKKNNSDSFTGKVISAIAKITGYKIESISLEDRFQEDLGIDSIKKADIIFGVVKSENLDLKAVNIGEFNTIEDTLKLKTSSSKKDDIYLPKFHMCKLRNDNYYFSRILLKDREKVEIQKIKLSKILERKFKLDSKNILIEDDYVLPTNVSTEELYDVFVKKVTLSVLFFLKELIKQKNFTLVYLLYEDSNWISKSLKYLFRAAKVESKLGKFQVLELKNKAFYDSLLKKLSFINQDTVDALSTNDSSSFKIENLVKIEDGAVIKPKNFNSKTIVAIGGLGGLGYSILSRLLNEFTDINLIVCGRRDKNDKDIIEKIQNLSKTKNNILYRKIDAVLKQDIADVLDLSMRSFGQIDYVLNFTGKYIIKNISDIDDSDVEDEMNNRFKTFLNLAILSSKYNYEIVNSGSFIGRCPMGAQAIYTLGNGSIEEYSIDNPNIKMTNIYWPAWELGMVKDTVAMNLRAKMSFIDEDDGYSFFKKCLSSDIRNIFILEDKNISQLPFYNIEDFRINQILGKRQGSFVINSSVIFLNEYNKKSYFANNHKIRGIVFLPISLLISKDIMCGLYWTKKNFKVLDFKVKNSIKIQDPINMSTSVLKVGNSYQISHYSDTTYSESSIKSFDYFNPEIKKNSSKLIKSVDMQKIYDDIKLSKILYLDYPYTTLDNLFIYEDCAVSTRTYRNLVRFSDITSMNWIMNMVEMATQTSTFHGYHMNKKLYFPSNIDEIFFYKGINIKKIIIKSVISEINEDMLIADSYVLNENNEVVMYFKNRKFNSIKY